MRMRVELAALEWRQQHESDSADSRSMRVEIGDIDISVRVEIGDISVRVESGDSSV